MERIKVIGCRRPIEDLVLQKASEVFSIFKPEDTSFIKDLLSSVDPEEWAEDTVPFRVDIR